MRRLKVLTILLFCSSWFLTGQTLEERDKKIVQQNNIKSRTQWDYNYKNGVQLKDGKKVLYTAYSSAGNILEENTLGGKGDIMGWEKYQYDAAGNRILYERSSGTGKYKVVSQYNTKNMITLESGFNGVENFRKTYSYNPGGRPLEIVYLVNNKEDEKFIYKHEGNIAKVDIYTKGSSSPVSKLRLVYDNSNNITEEKVLSLDNKEIEKKIFKFDTKGNILEEEKTKGGNFYYRLSYTYNANGYMLTASEENLSEKKFVKKSFQYDAKGNLVEYKWRRSPDEEFNSKTYTYDSKGICLTEKTIYPKTKFELLSKFEYEYY